jgi:hypothetical protein
VGSSFTTAYVFDLTLFLKPGTNLIAVAAVIAGIALTSAQEERRAKGVDLLQKYPTKLTAGDAAPTSGGWPWAAWVKAKSPPKS